MKPLKFIHITKTAGTTLEDEAQSCDILWGRFHEEYGWWHEIFPSKPATLKEKYNWFTVVRNPYSRIISEFHCQWGNTLLNNGRKAESFTKQEFNECLIHRINTYDSTGEHYTPQYLYIDKEVPVDVLRFENLKSEFHKLMKTYKLPVTINSHKNANTKVFNTTDINQKLRDLINKTYEKDFELFGYDIEL
jgi:hypothetical protein